MLEDSERLLKAHMDINADPSGTYKGLEAQKKMYDKLSSLRDGIRRHILAEDAHGKKELKESNQTEMTKDAFVAPDPADAGAGVDDADFAWCIGFDKGKIVMVLRGNQQRVEADFHADKKFGKIFYQRTPFQLYMTRYETDNKYGLEFKLNPWDSKQLFTVSTCDLLKE